MKSLFKCVRRFLSLISDVLWCAKTYCYEIPTEWISGKLDVPTGSVLASLGKVRRILQGEDDEENYTMWIALWMGISGSFLIHPITEPLGAWVFWSIPSAFTIAGLMSGGGRGLDWIKRNTVKTWLWFTPLFGLLLYYPVLTTIDMFTHAIREMVGVGWFRYTSHTEFVSYSVAVQFVSVIIYAVMVRVASEKTRGWFGVPIWIALMVAAPWIALAVRLFL